ncbi:Gfo/Idh/MocA family protein [Lacticaseibacillus mingshuiensis]|uniref:Gfo/Idh/MocA family protein n=1 Tax=Lacticaseibacillus mingshuiensis TaxID=2799574 RepID=UPI0019405097|nr:Gfo/Idh/MocA family oxidoreductase [Lacticaseibacillus mingshuiensis]
MKLAILGAGKIVHDFLPMVQALPSIEVAAICGLPQDEPEMTRLADQFPIAHVYTDINEGLADPAVDTVYVALPNALHFRFAKLALEAGKNVICEKPFTLHLAELETLKDIAEAKGVLLLEAITNQYLTNYQQIKADLPKLGDIKIVSCNYSQYSSRYDAFKAGTVLPVFDPKLGGGALMDLNIYNIHFVVGLLGKPVAVDYFANIDRGVDTSGILTLTYPTCQALCIAAKDCAAPVTSSIQGDAGSIIVEGPTNTVERFDETLNGQPSIQVDRRVSDHRMFQEFDNFERLIRLADHAEADRRMAHSEAVMQVVDAALNDAGITLG